MLSPQSFGTPARRARSRPRSVPRTSHPEPAQPRSRPRPDRPSAEPCAGLPHLGSGRERADPEPRRREPGGKRAAAQACGAAAPTSARGSTAVRRALPLRSQPGDRTRRAHLFPRDPSHGGGGAAARSSSDSPDSLSAAAREAGLGAHDNQL